MATVTPAHNAKGSYETSLDRKEKAEDAEGKKYQQEINKKISAAMNKGNFTAVLDPFSPEVLRKVYNAYCVDEDNARYVFLEDVSKIREGTPLYFYNLREDTKEGAYYTAEEVHVKFNEIKPPTVNFGETGVYYPIPGTDWTKGSGLEIKFVLVNNNKYKYIYREQANKIKISWKKTDIQGKYTSVDGKPYVDGKPNDEWKNWDAK